MNSDATDSEIIYRINGIILELRFRLQKTEQISILIKELSNSFFFGTESDPPNNMPLLQHQIVHSSAYMKRKEFGVENPAYAKSGKRSNRIGLEDLRVFEADDVAEAYGNYHQVEALDETTGRCENVNREILHCERHSN